MNHEDDDDNQTKMQARELDEVEADALESQDLDFKEWPADDRHAVRLAVDMAVCMANGGGGSVVQTGCQGIGRGGGICQSGLRQ